MAWEPKLRLSFAHLSELGIAEVSVYGPMERSPAFVARPCSIVGKLLEVVHGFALGRELGLLGLCSGSPHPLG